MRALRSYSFIPALLALSLVLTAATPLIRTSCGMSLAEMAEMPCCKDKAGHHDVPAMPSHEGMMADGDMPCHDAPEEPAPCPEQGATLSGPCCFTADAPTAPPPDRPQLGSTALVALVAAFVLPIPPPADAYASPPSAPSPPAPVALHLLYGSFLT